MRSSIFLAPSPGASCAYPTPRRMLHFSTLLRDMGDPKRLRNETLLEANTNVCHSDARAQRDRRNLLFARSSTQATITNRRHSEASRFHQRGQESYVHRYQRVPHPCRIIDRRNRASTQAARVGILTSRPARRPPSFPRANEERQKEPTARRQWISRGDFGFRVGADPPLTLDCRRYHDRGCPTRRGFRRVGTSDLRVSSIHATGREKAA